MKFGSLVSLALVFLVFAIHSSEAVSCISCKPPSQIDGEPIIHGCILEQEPIECQVGFYDACITYIEDGNVTKKGCFTASQSYVEPKCKLYGNKKTCYCNGNCCNKEDDEPQNKTSTCPASSLTSTSTKPTSGSNSNVSSPSSSTLLEATLGFLFVVFNFKATATFAPWA